MIQIMGRVLLLATALLVGCSSVTGLGPDLPANQEIDSAVGETDSSASDAALAETTASTEPESVEITDREDAGGQAGDSLASGGVTSDSNIDPEFGEIIFALDVTDEYAPVNAGLLFNQGITEIHAIFDYAGMTPTDTWERVWYLNDREISRSSDLWSGPETGVFDYFIDNGGEPLPTGDWILELYVNGELHSLGVFIIEESP